MEVPQIWYAVKRSSSDAGPDEDPPEDVDDPAERATPGRDRLGRQGDRTPVPFGWLYAWTVTRVPSGVSGKTTAALDGGISTQPSLWGKP